MHGSIKTIISDYWNTIKGNGHAIKHKVRKNLAAIGSYKLNIAKENLKWILIIVQQINSIYIGQIVQLLL